MAGARQVRRDAAVFRNGHPVEQHVLDANMVMKPFEMTQARRRTGDMQVQRWRTMSGQVDVVRIGERINPEKAGDTAATTDVGLHDVDGACVQHMAVIVGLIPVFPGCDLHAVRRAFADQP